MRGVKFQLCFVVCCLLLLDLVPFGGARSLGATYCGGNDLGTCVPNADNYGYFETGWRQWPGQQRSMRTFSEPIPVPEVTGDVPFPAEERAANLPDMSPREVAEPVQPPINAPPPEATISPPAAEPPLPTTSPPAVTPRPSESGMVNRARHFLPRSVTQAAKPATHRAARNWNDPGDWRGEAVKPAVPAAERVTYHDPVQPWAKPRNWREQVRPMDEQAGPGVQRATYQDHLAQPPAVAVSWQAEITRPEKPAARPRKNLAETRDASPGLNGYCPVELVENEHWLAGDRRWGVIHRGRKYLMSGPTQQQSFLANPDRYAPVLSGDDPVWRVDRNRPVRGKTDFCVVYDGRLYMFAEAATLARFRQNPKQYAAAAQQTGY